MIDFEKFLQECNAQKKIDKLSKKYRNKRIILFGIDDFCITILKNYDLSKLNIIAISDIENNSKLKTQQLDFKYINSKDLSLIDADLILISNYDYNKSLIKLDDEILYLSKNSNIEIRPLINLTFVDLFL